MSTLLPPRTDAGTPAAFTDRHIGIGADAQAHMLEVVGYDSVEALVETAVPASIHVQARATSAIPTAATEAEALAELRELASANRSARPMIGLGYYDTFTPSVIARNVLENPSWYTAYTPYQPEISQGRLEALINFQTMVTDLTGLATANASMLDESTAVVEGMLVARRASKAKTDVFLVDLDALPQTRALLHHRAAAVGVRIVETSFEGDLPEAFGAFVQYPGATGRIWDFSAVAEAVHATGGLVVAAADLLALTLLRSPGSLGADVAVGTTQRFGVPLGFGGPHAGYMAVRAGLERQLPGRLVGVSQDAVGAPAYRLSLQTREQHIRREKATSNICTAQVLPAVIASMYAVYHGPEGLKRIAQRVASFTAILAKGLVALGHTAHHHESAFDTLCLHTKEQTGALLARAVERGANLRVAWNDYLCISLDETTTRADIELLWSVFAADGQALPRIEDFADGVSPLIPAELLRTSAFLTHPVFNTHHSETGMLRYIRQLSDKDLALDRSMIPLGSCTMKLNATSEMIPITWPEFAQVHPFAPADQLEGYRQLDEQLRAWLCQATGYAGISLQPNAGSQGEYAGLLAIKAYHASKGQAHRNICLIPSSAHGTNPASAQMVGLQVVVTKCDENGNVDMADLQLACEKHSANLACIMITYPSTHGVFETQVKELCQLVHSHGGRVYVDGANMNAQVGLAAPGEFGGDVSHLNLHKTFCIPHGGGGPGVGPVCVVEDLVPFLPGHATAGVPGKVGAVSAAPLGNAAVLPISWMYIRMMGEPGLKRATETAILNANYISKRLEAHFPTLYAGEHGHVAHECILDLRHFKDSCGVMAEDVAKRLIDYGFHAPTLSFPVPNTLMVEPTESESLYELDRFIAAMIAIRGEIADIEAGRAAQDDNLLKNAPHTAETLLASEWSHSYSREAAAYPVPALRRAKYWSPVGRVDNVYGDRNLFCSCVPLDSYGTSA